MNKNKAQRQKRLKSRKNGCSLPKGIEQPFALKRILFLNNRLKFGEHYVIIKPRMFPKGDCYAKRL